MENQVVHTDVLIVGAGLSGLVAGWQLKKLGIGFRIVEARSRVGGRIYSPPGYADDYDLGPSWIWPGQHRVAQLLSELNLDKFDQPVAGTTLIQLQNGELQKYHGLPPMAGAFRIRGGSTALTKALAHSLAANNSIFLDHHCAAIRTIEQGVQLQISTAKTTHEWNARAVAIATPPRIAAKLSYSPALSSNLQHALQQLPTWMAAHAKVIALFDKPFWRDQDLSGTVMSQAGPLVEIHDASPFNSGPYALFGFVGYPASARQQIGEAELLDSVNQQLVNIFGSEAKCPIKLILQDWSQEPFTADQQDLLASAGHPAYGLSTEPCADWANRLYFISSETNHDNGGLIEGAVDRATRFATEYSQQR